MSYKYETHRPYVFTEQGQERFLAVLTFAKRAIVLAGAVSADRLDSAAMSVHPAGDIASDSFDYMACTDRLVELEYIKEVNRENGRWQDRIFVQGNKVFP